jgi:cell division protease FtsH
MNESPDPRQSANSQARNDETPFNWKSIAIFITIAALILVMLGINLSTAKAIEISYPAFVKAIESDQIDTSKNLTIVTQDTSNQQFIRGLLKADSKILSEAITLQKQQQFVDLKTKGNEAYPFVVQVNPSFHTEQINSLLAKKQLALSADTDKVNWTSGLLNMLPLMLLMILIFFLVRQQFRSAKNGALSFGRSRAKPLTQDKNRITFKDVAGITEAKEEVMELVDYLRDPKKFQALGGRIPKGVLMVGAPGTGKTLLAKAIAGEANVPFYSISGSDFVEMFVGVGASRVRDMFETGKKNAPCLIFIDEIDAVGRHRGHGMGGGHDEREQTLNALLVEMDGFETADSGVIIIAATNRPDVLDPALLRPGRFDRQVTVPLPDLNGREKILTVHAKKVKLSKDVDLKRIARGTPGFSGAELANLVNEAALLAARKNLTEINLEELEEARDKVRWGRERRTMAMSDKEKEATAWHEAGHALVNVALENTHQLHKVTIIPRGPYLGATMQLPTGDKYSTQKREALDQLAMTAAGRIAEQLYTQDVSNGAAGDILQMTELARKMICEWGMSEKLGMVGFKSEQSESQIFVNSKTNYAESTATLIDAEVKQLIDNAYQRAQTIILEHRDKLEIMAKALMEYETLEGEQIRDIYQHGRMLNPPKDKPTPKEPPADSTPPSSTQAETTSSILNGLNSGLSSAPA